MMEMASCDVISCGGQWIEAGLSKYTSESLLRVITLIFMGWGREMQEVEERRTVGENLRHASYTAKNPFRYFIRMLEIRQGLYSAGLLLWLGHLHCSL